MKGEHVVANLVAARCEKVEPIILCWEAKHEARVEKQSVVNVRKKAHGLFRL